MYVTEDDRIARRAEKIAEWLEYIERGGVYADFISRPSELASASGWDSEPQTRPCECRIEWQRGRLCLACDNTGWRPLAPGEQGIDPYSAEVPKRASVRLIESDASRKAAEAAYIDRIIERLEHEARVRGGVDFVGTVESRRIAIASKQNRMVGLITDALVLLRSLDPDQARRASKEAIARALAHLIPGRLYHPPIWT